MIDEQRDRWWRGLEDAGRHAGFSQERIRWLIAKGLIVAERDTSGTRPFLILKQSLDDYISQNPNEVARFRVRLPRAMM